MRMPAETCEESLELMHIGEWLPRKELPYWYYTNVYVVSAFLSFAVILINAV